MLAALAARSRFTDPNSDLIDAAYKETHAPLNRFPLNHGSVLFQMDGGEGFPKE